MKIVNLLKHMKMYYFLQHEFQCLLFVYLNDLISSIDSVLKNGCDNSVIHVCDNIISRYDFACKVSIQLVGNHDLIKKTKNPNKSVFFPNLSLIDSGFINKLTTSKNLWIEFN